VNPGKVAKEMDFLNELKTSIIETLNLTDVEPSELTTDTAFFEDGLNLDSIDILELAVMIEEMYGVSIENRELGEKVFITLGTLARYIEENRNGT
jgi:acyl carrier protein